MLFPGVSTIPNTYHVDNTKSVNLFDMVVIFTYFLIIMGIGLFFMKANKGGRST